MSDQMATSLLEAEGLILFQFYFSSFDIWEYTPSPAREANSLAEVRFVTLSYM